jgi:DHA1 family multidrug resistance protein-like MFS transporter
MKKNTLILSFTLLVVMLGYGMVMPIMPFYIEKLGVGGTELGWLMSTYSLMQLMCAPLWGILSDRIGRKPVISIGVLGYAITLLFFGLSNTYWMLFIARTLSGILSSATMPTAMAYIGDNAPEKERSKGMGQLGAMMGVGVIVGPLLGGFLSADSLSLPFFIGSGMAFAAFLLTIFALPESHKMLPVSGKKSGLSWKRLRPVLLSPAGVLLLLVLMMSFGMSNFQGITGLYVVDKFAFNTKQVGTIWMVMGAMMILVQGVLTGPLTRRFGDQTLIHAGLAGGALGFLAMTAANSYITVLAALGFFSLWLAIISPVLNARMSVFAGNQQGTVMGMNSAASSLGRVIGPLWAGYLYDFKMEYPYWSGAAVLLLGLLVSWGFGLRRAAKAEAMGAAESEIGE